MPTNTTLAKKTISKTGLDGLFLVRCMAITSSHRLLITIVINSLNIYYHVFLPLSIAKQHFFIKNIELCGIFSVILYMLFDIPFIDRKNSKIRKHRNTHHGNDQPRDSRTVLKAEPCSVQTVRRQLPPLTLTSFAKPKGLLCAGEP